MALNTHQLRIKLKPNPVVDNSFKLVKEANQITQAFSRIFNEISDETLLSTMKNVQEKFSTLSSN